MTLKVMINSKEYPVEIGDDFIFTAIVGEYSVAGGSLQVLRQEIEKTLAEIEKAGIDFAFQPRLVYNIHANETLIRGINQKDRKLLVTNANGTKTSVSHAEHYFAINDEVESLIKERRNLWNELRRVDALLEPWRIILSYPSSHRGILSHLVALDKAISKAEEGESQAI